jgi:hypothetical protein
MANKTFIKITNEQIYKQFMQFQLDNEQQHKNIMKEIESLKTEIQNYRSQVTNLKLAIGGIGILTMATLGWFIVHLT